MLGRSKPAELNLKTCREKRSKVEASVSHRRWAAGWRWSCWSRLTARSITHASIIGRARVMVFMAKLHHRYTFIRVFMFLLSNGALLTCLLSPWRLHGCRHLWSRTLWSRPFCSGSAGLSSPTPASLRPVSSSPGGRSWNKPRVERPSPSLLLCEAAAASAGSETAPSAPPWTEKATCRLRLGLEFRNVK